MNDIHKVVADTHKEESANRVKIVVDEYKKDRVADLAKTFLASEESINADLLKYVDNRKLTVPEDTTVEEIEHILGRDAQKQLIDASLTPAEKGSVKKILGQVRNFKKRNKNYLDNYEEKRKEFSEKARMSIRNIEEESGGKVKVVVDKELIKNFRAIQGISYRGGAFLGQYIVVDDPQVLEDETFLRHEAIHCAQQRDLFFSKPGRLGLLRWSAISGVSLLLKRAKIRGLDEDMDYGTDNQVTDYETYLNQFSKGYLKTRQPNAWRKYRNHDFRKQEMNRFKIEEIDALKAKLLKLQNDLKHAEMGVSKEKISLEIKKVESDIAQYERIYEDLKHMDEVFVVMIKPDVQGHKKDDTREQVYFESKANRDIRLPIEKFIQKYGDKADNYKQGTEMYVDIHDYISKRTKGTVLPFLEFRKFIADMLKKYHIADKQGIVLSHDIEKLISENFDIKVKRKSFLKFPGFAGK